jgi:hypothetical protein
LIQIRLSSSVIQRPPFAGLRNCHRGTEKILKILRIPNAFISSVSAVPLWPIFRPMSSGSI